MKLIVVHSTDGFDKPDGSLIAGVSIGELVTSTGATQGDFVEVFRHNFSEDITTILFPAERRNVIFADLSLIRKLERWSKTSHTTIRIRFHFSPRVILDRIGQEKPTDGEANPRKKDEHPGRQRR